MKEEQYKRLQEEQKKRELEELDRMEDEQDNKDFEEYLAWIERWDQIRIDRAANEQQRNEEEIEDPEAEIQRFEQEERDRIEKEEWLFAWHKRRHIRKREIEKLRNPKKPDEKENEELDEIER